MRVYGFGIADGLAVLVGVGLGVAVAFGLDVGDGVTAVEGRGVVVGLTKIIRIAPSSGTGETMDFLRVSTMPTINTTKKRKTTMSVIAATVFRRSSIPLV
ncbi:hypothetical protein HY032_02990 [Candidatus Gottesmanbacteria bacterium]|nr:hypothetical protein [Candidatus Gottesmanbacteria bacterium]